MSLYFNLSGKRKQTTGTDLLITDIFGILKNLDRGIWLKTLLNTLFPGIKWKLDDLEKINFKFFHRLKIKNNQEHNDLQEIELDLMLEGKDFLIFFIVGSAIKNIIPIIQLASLYSWKVKKNYYFIFLNGHEEEPEIINKLKEPEYLDKLMPGREDSIIMARRICWLSWNKLAYFLSDSYNLFQKTEKKFILDILDMLHQKKLAKVRYFAYGINLNANQMEKRAPSHSFCYTAKAIGYKLCFPHHSSLWKGGVASLEHSSGNSTQGVVYHISEYDRKNLDHYEGVEKNIYYRDAIRIYDFQGNPHWAFTYLAVEKDKDYHPSAEYLNKIIAGGLHWQLDESYIEHLKKLQKNSD